MAFLRADLRERVKEELGIAANDTSFENRQRAQQSLDLFRQLDTANQISAKILLNTKYNFFSSQLKDDILGWCKEVYPTIKTKDVPKNRFYAVAWLCGASWRQISTLFGVSPSACRLGVDRLIPPDTRTDARLVKRQATMEEVSAIKRAYIEIANQDADFTVNMDIVSVAKAVLTLANMYTDKDSIEPGEATRRIGNTTTTKHVEDMPSQSVSDEEIIVDNPQHNVPEGVDPFDPSRMFGVANVSK